MDEDRALTSQVPWYETLEGGFSLRGFRMSKIGRWVTHGLVTALEFLRVAPKGTTKASEILMRAADSLVEGGQRGIFTPMLFILARKPE